MGLSRRLVGLQPPSPAPPINNFINRAVIALTPLSPSDLHQGQRPPPDCTHEGTCRGRRFAPVKASRLYQRSASAALYSWGRVIPAGEYPGLPAGVRGCRSGQGVTVCRGQSRRAEPSRRVLMSLGPCWHFLLALHLCPVLPGGYAPAQIRILNQQLCWTEHRRLGVPPPSSTRSQDFLASAARASRARLLS